MDDAEYVICAYGSVARTAKAAVNMLRAEGVKIGLIRPITIVPFPKKAFEKKNVLNVKAVFCAEMSIPPQFIDDVTMALGCKKTIHPILTSGGVILEIDQILREIREKI